MTPTKIGVVVLLSSAGIVFVSWCLLGGGRGLAIYRRATASKLRRVVFSILFVVALFDAVGVFGTWNDLPVVLRICLPIMRLQLSLLFIAFIALIWDWLARRLRRTSN